MDAGTDSYSRIKSDAFDGTIMPIRYIPDWTKPVYQDKEKRFEDIPISDFIALPLYDADTLLRAVGKHDKMSLILRYTYTVPYMWSYRLNYKEDDGSHLAVDIRAPIGTPILSIANGVVVRTVESDSTGNKYVVIRHNDVPWEWRVTTLYSSYLHLSQINVTEGTKIKKWEMLGRVWNTGISTAPHLHFQIDTADAPFYPYWPFSSAESRNAGLWFFQSVNAGLGRENARKYTIHPMLFVNKYLWWVWDSVPQGGTNTTSTVISETLSNEQSMREREILLWWYRTNSIPTCSKKRYRDVAEWSALGKLLYNLVDNRCLFQDGEVFSPRDSVKMSEALMVLMDLHRIEPATGTSHFLDVRIGDRLQGYALSAYRRWIIEWNYLHPEKILTRWEFISLLVKVGNVPKNPSQIRIFADAPTIHKNFESIQSYGLLIKARGGRVFPDAIMTRTHLVQILSWIEKYIK